MDSVRVKIKSRFDSATHGALRPGDVVVTDAETARHFVEDCKAGEYEVSGMDPAAPGSDHSVETPQHKDAARGAKHK